MKQLPINKILLVMIIILSGLLVYLIKTAPSTNNKNEQIIELKSDGFHPDILTVEKGTTVKFVNSKGGAFWPASDPHPMHTDLSEFDAKQAIASGQSWSFTFNKLGVWGFHDHLSPYFVGKITVVSSLQTKSIQDSGCQSDKNIKACWKQALLVILNTEGLGKVLDEVATLYETLPQFASSCHDIMHDIGHKSYKNYLKDRDSVINPKAFYCADGFYHGFMESFLDANPDLVKAHDFCALVGKKLKDKAPDAELSCYHGIGHGLIDASFVSSQSVTSEESILKPALANCEIVSDTPEQLYRCASGAFNGIANFYITGEHNLKVRPDDPFFICKNQPDKYKESCYGNFNSIIFWLAKNDFTQATHFITTMQDKKYQKMTTMYLAGLAALSFAKVSPEKAIISCRDLGDLKTSCLEGFAHGFLEHGQPNKEYQEAINFCTNKTLTRDESDHCLYFTLSGITSWYSRDKSVEICNSINPEYKKYCPKL